MIEVEAKVKIKDPSKAREKISSIAYYVGREKKVDDYYTLESLDSYPKKSLRIRKKGNIYEINFKQRLSYVKGVHAKKEIEFKASDISDFLKLITDFGFRKWLTKEKTTELYKINNNFHIEINYVKNLGWFLEIECLTDKHPEIVRSKVLQIIKKLEFNKKDIVKEGYTKMLWNKMR